VNVMMASVAKLIQGYFNLSQLTSEIIASAIVFAVAMFVFAFMVKAKKLRLHWHS